MTTRKALTDSATALPGFGFVSVTSLDPGVLLSRIGGEPGNTMGGCLVRGGWRKMITRLPLFLYPQLTKDNCHDIQLFQLNFSPVYAWDVCIQHSARQARMGRLVVSRIVPSDPPS